jgi:hypothetical protein
LWKSSSATKRSLARTTVRRTTAIAIRKSATR